MAKPSAEKRVEWRKWAGESEVFDGSIVTRLLDALEDAEAERDEARAEAGQISDLTLTRHEAELVISALQRKRTITSYRVLDDRLRTALEGGPSA